MEDMMMTLLTIAVGFIKLGQGFDFDFKATFIGANKPMILKGVIVGVFLVPAFFLLLILLIKPSFQIAAALILMAVCPAADLSIQQIEKIGGNVPLGAGVQVISALLSIITIPISLKIFEFVIDIHIEIEIAHVAREVATAQFIPMVAGITLRKFFPTYAWIAKLMMKAARILLALCFIFLFIHNYTVFSEFEIRAYLMVFFAICCAFILGVIFSGKDVKRQISLAIEASLRNPGLAFLIASENFSTERVHLAILPYISIQVLTVVLCAFLLKQWHRRRMPAKV